MSDILNKAFTFYQKRQPLHLFDYGQVLPIYFVKQSTKHSKRFLQLYTTVVILKLKTIYFSTNLKKSIINLQCVSQLQLCNKILVFETLKKLEKVGNVLNSILLIYLMLGFLLFPLLLVDFRQNCSQILLACDLMQHRPYAGWSCESREPED